MSAYLAEIFGLTGRTAVVTGGSSGIGRAMAGALGRAGARVVLVARRPEPLAETVKELIADGVQADAVTVDLADRAAVIWVTVGQAPAIADVAPTWPSLEPDDAAN